MDIDKFLLARIDDDEADAQQLERDLSRLERETARNGPDGSQGSIVAAGIRGSAVDPARVLAECEAKRRIVEYAQEWRAAFKADRVGFDRMDALLTSTHMLELLAAHYSDHPDYNPEWSA